MKFKYIPGMRPTPMLMYQIEPNQEVFQVMEDSFEKNNYIDEFNHMWNMGAYFIYNDDLEIISYRISNVHNFLWLLRALNKDITIEFNNDFIEKNQDFIKEVSEELITM